MHTIKIGNLKKEVIFINSHPIQYFVPLYKYLNDNGVPTSAWYCTKETINGAVDKEFGLKVKWDIPLLEGYNYKFFRNHSVRPSHERGFFGLVNFGMILNIFKIQKSVIVVHGWHYCTHFLIIAIAKLMGHTVCLRYEMPYNQEVLKSGIKQKVKTWFLRYIVFSRVDKFLFIGTQNRNLYEKIYKIPSKQLLFAPYSVDNTRFKSEYLDLQGSSGLLREKLGISKEDVVILYSGKYIDKKRPLDIVNAFAKLNNDRCWLVMLGDGELRREIEDAIDKMSLKKVLLTGFVNQSRVAEYYAISDVFVMCSSIGETWGLSVNEALNFKLPIVVSDLTGSSTDLVLNGQNGFVFKTGDVGDLAQKLEWVISDLPRFNNNVHTDLLLEKFSYESVTACLRTLLDR